MGGSDSNEDRGRSVGVTERVLPVYLPLVAAVALAKAFAAGSWSWWSVRFPAKWALISYQDVAFITAWAMIGAAVLWATPRRPRLARVAVGSAFLAGSMLICAYAIIGADAYAALRMPLTYPLLSMAGGFTGVQSSVRAQVTWPDLAVLAAGPLVYLWAVRWLRGARWARWARSGRFGAVALACVALYLPVAAWGYRHRIAGGPDDGLAASPHLALLESFVGHWRSRAGAAADFLDGRRPVIADPLNDDFLPFGQRRMPRAATAATAATTTTLPASRVRNVIVVVLESTGTQFMSLYGSPYATTPHLQAEAAAHGLVLNHFYCNAGYTLHAMMPLVLSLYPGSGWKIYLADCPHLPATSLADVLHERGYRTAFMLGGLIDFKNTRSFFEGRGFDEVCGAEDLRRLGAGPFVSSWGLDDASLFDHLLQWIDRGDEHSSAHGGGEGGGRPFYALVWTQQTHHPYTLPAGQSPHAFIPDADGERGRLLNLYLNDLRGVDGQLGRLFDHLRSRGLDRDTLVVVTGDHGEAFGVPHPWFFHGTALYEENVNVPCVFWSPALFPTGRRSDAVAAQVDLNPTLLDLLHPAPVPPADWQGHSLFDPTRPDRAYFSCNTGNLLVGLREGREKFIYNVTLARQELYDLSTDPREQHNLAPSDPQRCQAYRQRLAAFASFERHHLEGLAAQAIRPRRTAGTPFAPHG